ncbi:MAG: SRPBCC domain-containing protein [Saprospiraceae bacterium]|nr:SRPBCC domain-containing protein [Saprospiraceae bacterium]
MEFTLKTHIRASAQDIYKAWLSSEGHTEMTGAVATSSDKVGDEYSAWDGYITGKNLELDPFRRIYQSWRTTDFSEDEPDSRLEVILEQTDDRTTITLKHTNLPDHGEQYRTGWEDHYFQSMKVYFTKSKSK